MEHGMVAPFAGHFHTAFPAGHLLNEALQLFLVDHQITMWETMGILWENCVGLSSMEIMSGWWFEPQ